MDQQRIAHRVSKSGHKIKATDGPTGRQSRKGNVLIRGSGYAPSVVFMLGKESSYLTGATPLNKGVNRMNDVDFKSIPWYHILWLIPWICLVVMLYPFFLEDENWPY
jgi:hypothetical protein